MLKSLLIENYALIQKLDIRFDDGLTIITGETGAGKSILLGAVALILGQRADTRVLFNESRKCIIEGQFKVDDLNLKSLFQKNELDYDSVAIFRREITPQGKSRAFINDTPVNLNVMKEFAGFLIDIHSQHQNLIVGKSFFRYDVVDSFAGINQQVNDYKKEFDRWEKQKRHLEDIKEKQRQSVADLDYYKFQYDELEKASLQHDEADQIESELNILSNASEIKENLQEAETLLQNSETDILSSVHRLLQMLQPIEKYDAEIASFSERIRSVEIEIKDIAREIGLKNEDISLDPHRLAELQQRFDLIQKLMFKHRVNTIEQLMKIRDDFYSKIEGSDSLELEIEENEKEVKKIENALGDKASKISSLRNKSIPALQKEIDQIIHELAMPDGKFVVKQTPADQLHRKGSDQLEFLFTANKGKKPESLEKVASGGELSRLMLAVKSVISMKNLLPTIIFDEIDTGVSGETGFKIGKILKSISRNMQVIAVTHLPQVAAQGIRHFIVFKETIENKTYTRIKQVEKQKRVEEIAKMLGGENPTDAVLQTASELLNKQKEYS